MPRVIEFFDGSDSSTSPSIGNISASDLVKYANDGAFEAAEAGSPVGGNIYYNTTDDVVRYYDDNLASWISVLSDQIVDSNFQISDDGDTTKKMRFEVSSVSTGTIRVYTVPDADTTLVGTDVSQTLTNKTIDADNNTLINLEHGSEVDDPSSGVHGVTGDVVGTTDTQNISGKTFTDSTNFTDTTESTSKDTGAIIVEGGVGIEKNLHVGGNLTVDGTTTTVNTADLDVEDANITVNKGGDQSTADSQHAGLTVEMSDATDADIGYESALASKFHCGEVGSEEEIITSGHAQEISNKDIDLGTASDTVGINVSGDTRANLEALTRNEARVYYSEDEEKLLYDTGTELKEAGSGSGSGGINHVPVDDAQFETTSIKTWAVYSDGGSDPTDGTGGTTFTTIALDSVGNLRDDKSMKWSKDANNRQGEGISIDLTFDAADQSNLMEFSFDYSTTANFDYDGTGGRSDVTMWVYDITNANMIQPSNFELDGSGRYVGYFQAAADSTSYRAILHINGTNALAWDMVIDNVRVGPATEVYGTPATDVKNGGTISVGAITTPPTKGTTTIDQVDHNRVGDKLFATYTYRQTTTASTGSGTYLIDLPDTLSADLTKVSATTTTSHLQDVQRIGSGIMYLDTTTDFVVTMDLYMYDETRMFAILGPAVSDTGSGDPSTLNAWSSTTMRFNQLISFRFNIEVPIKGWGANASATGDDGRQVIADYETDAGQSISNGSIVIVDFEDKVTDTHNKVTTGGSWNFEAPVSGQYKVDTTVTYSPATATYISSIYLYKNGSVYRRLDSEEKATSGSNIVTLSGGTIIELNAGDTIDIRTDHSHGSARVLWSTAGNNFVTVERLSSNAAVIPFIEPVVYIKDKKDISTNGGTFTSGAWQTRDLNDISGDDWLVSLSSNQFTLGPGIYDIEASAPAFQTGRHQIKLRDITNSVDTEEGTSKFNGSIDVVTTSHLETKLILTESTTFEIQHRCQTTKSTDGFGVRNQFSSNVYTQVKIKKRRV